MGDKRFGDEGGARVHHYQRGARLYSGGIHVRGGSDSVTAVGAAPRVRAAKSSEFGEGKCEHLRWARLEQVQHCTDFPREVTLPAHTEQGKMGPGLG